MPSNTNLKGIRERVREWSQRRNISDSTIDGFIEIALSRACRLLRIPPLEAFSSAIPDANGLMILPNNFQEVIELKTTWNNEIVILDRKDISEVEYRQGQSLVSSASPYIGPRVFGRKDNYLKVAPWNGQDASVDLYYYRIDFPLTDDTSTNWFTKYAAELLIYGALVELSNYTRDNGGYELWNMKFNEMINTIQGVEDRAKWQGSTIGVTLPGSTQSRAVY